MRGGWSRRCTGEREQGEGSLSRRNVVRCHIIMLSHKNKTQVSMYNYRSARSAYDCSCQTIRWPRT
jgi:hypothetical protein